MDDVDLQPVTAEERDEEPHTDRRPDAHVEQRARPEDDAPVEMAHLVDEAAIRVAHPIGIDRRRAIVRGKCHVRIIFVQSRVSDQPARLADLVHDAIAGIDAEGAGDAGQLLAIADVDAHRTDGDASVAIDAVADRLAGGCGLFGVLCTRFSAPVVIGYNQRIVVQHGRLNARPRAHVDADLFPHQPAEDIGGGSQDTDG